METKEKEEAKEVKQPARAKRDQEAHEMEMSAQWTSTHSEKAYTLRNCIMMGEQEDGENWKASMKPQWTAEQLDSLMGKLYEVLMAM